MARDERAVREVDAVLGAVAAHFDVLVAGRDEGAAVDDTITIRRFLHLDAAGVVEAPRKRSGEDLGHVLHDHDSGRVGRQRFEDLAQRSPLPVAVTVTGTIERTPETVQTAAYFVVAEALTNAAKHSEAATARVSVERTDTVLAATIVDDGRGGANPQGSGLAGLQKRVRALDGRLDVISPPGGPTVVRAEIPCA